MQTKRAQAELLFGKLQLKRVYEVLSDANQWVIYDCLEEKGLEEQGWEVVQRTKTPQEIREEYEALARVREERSCSTLRCPKCHSAKVSSPHDTEEGYK